MSIPKFHETNEKKKKFACIDRKITVETKFEENILKTQVKQMKKADGRLGKKEQLNDAENVCNRTLREEFLTAWQECTTFCVKKN